MKNFQLNLFYDLELLIQTSKFYRKYYLLFTALDLSPIPDKNYGQGCTGYSRHAMIRAFIVKHLEQIKTVPKLIEFLDSQPFLTEMCGFKMGILPHSSQFYRFLKHTPNSLLEGIHHKLNRSLIEQEIISTDISIIYPQAAGLQKIIKVFSS